MKFDIENYDSEVRSDLIAAVSRVYSARISTATIPLSGASALREAARGDVADFLGMLKGIDTTSGNA